MFINSQLMENFIMSISIDTKAKIKQALDNAVYALNNKKTNSSDCDWIFDDCKEMIIEAVNHKVSLRHPLELTR